MQAVSMHRRNAIVKKQDALDRLWEDYASSLGQGDDDKADQEFLTKASKYASISSSCDVHYMCCTKYMCFTMKFILYNF